MYPKVFHPHFRILISQINTFEIFETETVQKSKSHQSYIAVIKQPC